MTWVDRLDWPSMKSFEGEVDCLLLNQQLGRNLWLGA